MKRRGCVRGGCLVVGGVVALFLGAQVGWAPSERFTVLRPDGTPAAGAVVAFHYRGYRFNLVDSIDYERSGRIVRADARGVVELPDRLYLKGPLDGYLEPWIDLLYDPGVHFAFEAGDYELGRDGILAVRAGGRELVVADRTESPAAWERSLEELFSLVAYDLVYSALNGHELEIAASEAEMRELVDALGGEYRSFLARHRETARELPPRDAYFESLPAADRERLEARIRADLEREPLWGPYLERRWPDRLEQLDAAIARLP